MKTSKKILVAVVCLPFLVANGADGTWVAREGVGTGVTNWTEWNDKANWDGGSVASNGNATLTAAAAQYIHLPDTLTITNFGAAGNSVFLGEGTLTFAPRGSSHSPKACYLYCPFKTALLANYDNYCGLGGSGGALNICGTRLAGSGGVPLCDGIVNYRYDLFATAAGEERAVSELNVLVAAGVNLRFIAPHGSSTNLISRWVQTAGSVFLEQVDGETPHVLSAGTIVTGDGIPADTFLKRIFPDGSIELSAAPTTSAAANALTFAAFNAKTEVSLSGAIAAFNTMGTRNIFAQKCRAEDDFTLRMAATSFSFVGNNVASKKDLNQFAIKTEVGYLPGRIVISSTKGTEVVPCRIQLENCHLEIASDNSYYDYTQASIDGAAHTARITVTNNVTRKFAKLTKLAGTLVKDGAGTLSMHMPSDTAANLTGNIVVEDGTFSPEFPDAGTNSLASLTVKSGARFVVPEGVVLCVGSLVVEEGSILGGNGRIVCPEITDSVVAGLVLENGVSIDDGRTSSSFSVDVFSGDPEMSVIGDDSILVFGTNALLRVIGTGVVDVLVVGGGGGGGCKGGGGGGGGGVVYTQQMAVASGIYNLTVGRGGKGAPDKVTGNTSGGDSSVFGLLAYGGGAGGTYGGRKKTGASGGSGGGGGIDYPAGSDARYAGGDGIDGQGYAGGTGFNTNISNSVSFKYCSGAGGGGAGAPGTDAGVEIVNDTLYASGGSGGDGVLCEIYGSKYYGGGGGGGTTTTSLSGSHVGGLGGGGNGGNTSGSTVSAGKKGQDGFGGGGGGGSSYTAGEEGGAGGDGGSGVVILRWRRPVPEEGSVAPLDNPGVGGTLRCRNGYAIHKFSDNGTLVLPEPVVADILLVGGGGGGGSISGGGGGGGGVIVASNVYLVAGSYPVTVGVGGTGAQSSEASGVNGGDSVVSFRGLYAIKAIGGGGGGYNAAGKAGGSGGGGAGPLYSNTVLTYAGGAGTLGQGFAGGTGIHRYTGDSGSWQSCQGGGGGGAGEPGGNATTNVPGVTAVAPGNGGNGIVCDFSGEAVYYGGGGGGGSALYTSTAEHYKATGGLGGGGRGGSTYYVASESKVYVTPGEDGEDGLGGGGGGSGGYVVTTAACGNGGKGVVIIRYRVRRKGLILEFY